MTVIEGNNVIGFINDIPVFCGKDCVFSENKDSVEATGSVGKWKYNALQKRSWSIEITGLTKINSSDGQMDYFSMITDPFATDFHVVTVTFDDIDGNTVSITGTMFLPKSSINGPVKEFAGASVSFIGTGAYSLSTEESGGSGSGECVPVSGGTFDPPDAILGEAYSYTFPLTGTAPFTLGFNEWPSGIVANIVGSNLVLSGTPDDPGQRGDIDWGAVVDNACGEEFFHNTIALSDGGRTVFVINNTAFNIVLQNANGVQYTFLASNGSDGNFFMQDANADVISITTGATVNFEFLQSLPSSTINSGTVAGGGTATTSDYINTNYLRFT
jgi:hypothetical protein